MQLVTKRKTQAQRKIAASHVSNKGLLSKIQNKFLPISKKKETNTKKARHMIKQLAIEDI
jgi:hypothetical protein